MEGAVALVLALLSIPFILPLVSFLMNRKLRSRVDDSKPASACKTIRFSSSRINPQAETGRRPGPAAARPGAGAAGEGSEPVPPPVVKPVEAVAHHHRRQSCRSRRAWRRHHHRHHQFRPRHRHRFQRLRHRRASHRHHPGRRDRPSRLSRNRRRLPRPRGPSTSNSSSACACSRQWRALLSSSPGFSFSVIQSIKAGCNRRCASLSAPGVDRAAGGVRSQGGAQYVLLANAMDSAAIAILFATFFAAHSLWNLISGTTPSAARAGHVHRRDALDPARVAVHRGTWPARGFATPILLSTGENRPIPLFAYCCCSTSGLPGSAIAIAGRASAFSRSSLRPLSWGWCGAFPRRRAGAAGDRDLTVFPVVGYGVLMARARAHVMTR